MVALFGFTRGAGKLMGPVLCSHVLLTRGYSDLWMIAALISLAVAAILFLLHRRSIKDKAK